MYYTKYIKHFFLTIHFEDYKIPMKNLWGIRQIFFNLRFFEIAKNFENSILFF